ncbi:intracellular chloride channel [Aureococcus anophagefferens]|nr:intracellular chloride channel [Aureococcus anophagefferens]
MGASYQLDEVEIGAAKESELPNFKGSDLGRVPLVKIERKVTAGFPALGIKPIHIGNECRGKKMCRWRPYEHIHAKYDTHPDLVDLYAVPPSEEKTKWPFNSMMRTKLIWDILHSRVEDGGCGLDINSLTFHDDILAFLTLHDAAERNALYAAFIQQPWSSFVHPPYTHLPLAQYKNYFGEMHGMRMAFTAHITSAYYILAAVGFAILVETLVAGTEATKAVISYTFFLVIWSIVVSEKWKTRQCALSVTWGTRGFEENEKPRPQYTGYMVASPITGKPEVFFPPHERKPSIVANVFVVLFMILLNLAFLGVVFYLKAARPGFLGSIDFQLFSYFVSFVNAFGIQFFYFLFKAVAVQLNDRENWRTETQYHDYLTSKMFYFYIVNYYAPLYYLTFIQYYANPFTTNQKARGDDNGYDTVAEQVFGELRTTVIVILGVALVSQNASRVLMPLLKEYWQKSSEGGIDTEMSVPELQYVLFEYDEVLDTTYDYMLITMQYGYVILFSAAFPARPSAR